MTSPASIFSTLARTPRADDKCTGKDPIRCDDPDCPVHGKDIPKFTEVKDVTHEPLLRS